MVGAGGQTVYEQAQIARMVKTLADKIAPADTARDDLALVGIRTGGAHLAFRLQKILAKRLGSGPDTGVVDITLYRDDWTRLHHRPKVGATSIDFSIQDRRVVLVDDVVFTGRTTRAGLDALIDFGRPRRIEFAALIDRGGRELPIQPDYVGAKVGVGPTDIIDVLLTEQGAPADQVVIRPK